MSMPRWTPSTTTTKKEAFLLKRLTRTKKLFGFLRQVRAELFDEAFQGELEKMYRDTANRPEEEAAPELQRDIELQNLRISGAPYRSRLHPRAYRRSRAERRGRCLVQAVGGTQQ